MSSPNPSTPQLRPRHVQILALMSSGATRQQIAASLHISVPTLGKNITDLYLLLGVRSQAAAIAAGHRLGILSAPDAVSVPRGLFNEIVVLARAAAECGGPVADSGRAVLGSISDCGFELAAPAQR